MLNTNKYRVALTLLIGLAMAGQNQAQQTIYTEEIFSLGMQLGSGARAIAMGGAFTSIGGDFSTSLWNPAGLRDIQRIEVFGSVSHLSRENDFALTRDIGSFQPFGRKSEENFTKFNNIGISYPVPTTQGALVFAFGFNRVKSYDSNLDFRTFNNALDADSQPLSLNQSWRELERGSLNVWTMAGAIDVSPNASLGLGLNFWSGGSDFGDTYNEFDSQDLYEFQDYTVENGLNTDIGGFNAKFGALFRLGPMLRLGATVATPTVLKINEEFFSDTTEVFDPELSASDYRLSGDGIFEYKIRSPWSFTGGASLHFLNFVLSGDLEYNDWSQIVYRTAPPFLDENGDPVSRNRVNRDIADNYRATTRIRLGGEFTLPLTGLSFRAGYFLDPAIYQNANLDEDKQFLSAGIGLQVDKQSRLDVAYVRGFWKTFGSGLPPEAAISNYVEDITVNKLFVSLSLRM